MKAMIQKHEPKLEKCCDFMLPITTMIKKCFKEFRSSLSKTCEVFLEEVLKPMKTVNEATNKCVEEIYTNNLNVIFANLNFFY